MNKQIVISLAVLSALLLGACGPSEADLQATAAAVQTGAAATVNAQFTLNAQLTPSATHTPLPSNTPTASNTPTVGVVATATTAPVSGGAPAGGTAGGGCDAMAFVSDVTVPDGTDYAPNATFTKTWRVRNSGTCTWDTGYSVVFVSGTQMGGTSPQALTASIAPNATLDISVAMTAPANNGSYTGYWALRNDAGENFGSFYVQIDVTSGGTSGGSGSATPVSLSANSAGHWVSTNTTNGISGNIIAGDNASDEELRGFFSFNLSSIPSGATVTSVTLSYSGQDNLNPFQLGTLSLISTGSTASYDASGTTIATFANTGEVGSSVSNDALKSVVQGAIGSTLNFRVEFSGAPNSNGEANDFRFFSPSLTVNYTP